MKTVSKHTFVMWLPTDDAPQAVLKDFAAFADGLCGVGYRVNSCKKTLAQVKRDLQATEEVEAMFEEERG